jgi:hypothetical protein
MSSQNLTCLINKLRCTLSCSDKPPRGFYKGMVGQWSAVLDIIYSDPAREVQTFTHLYEFLEPEWIDKDETYLLMRVKRYTSPEAVKIIKESQGEIQDVYTGFYNNHLVSLVWDKIACRYIGKMVDSDDTTFNNFVYEGKEKMTFLSHEVSLSKENIENAHQAITRMYKLPKCDNIIMPSVQEIYDEKSCEGEKLTRKYPEKEWQIPIGQKESKDTLLHALAYTKRQPRNGGFTLA